MSVAVLRQPVTAAAESTLPEAMWRHLLDLLPSGLVVIDSQGRVVQANPVAIALLGEPLTGERWLTIIKRAFRPRADDGHEVSLHDGRRVKIETRPLAPYAGQLVVLTDLTETRELQRQISHLERLSALGRMVATLAHQVRTPLASATLYANHLADHSLAAEARTRFAAKLQARLADLEHQVNDMLRFARAGEQGSQETQSVAELLEQLAESCAGVVALNGARLTIAPAPDARFCGQPRAVAGALMNLVHNAIDAGGRGVAISVTAEVRGEQLLLQVCDNGPGVPAELRQRMFEPFFTTRGQGTGLGLAVVQAVARQHHGRVSYQPGADGGSCFLLQLPLTSSGMAEVA